MKGIVVDHCLEGLALQFKDGVLCNRFQTWSDIDSYYSLVLSLELATNRLRTAVDGRCNGDDAVWDIFASSLFVG